MEFRRVLFRSAEEKNQELNAELSNMEEELVAARKNNEQGGQSNEGLVAQLQESEARGADLEQELASISDQLLAKDQEVPPMVSIFLDRKHVVMGKSL